MPVRIILPLLLFLAFSGCGPEKPAAKAPEEQFRVVGYYCGTSIPVDSFEIEKLTHLIFCFGHLHDNKFEIGSAADSATIKRMVELKSRNPQLKVMLSLGGWGGCASCSGVFNSAQGRREFAESVKEISAYFKTDGLDLDWEYPAIKGFPEHIYRKEDRNNFTALLKEIREVNGDNFELSFAAGGFTSYIDSSIDWKSAVQYTDFINIMTYDLVHGYSTVSGHHTPLYSTPEQKESTDHAVNLLLKAGVPANQIVIGAAFYGRFFHIEGDDPVGLYQPCKFTHGFSSKYILDSLSSEKGFVLHWDSIAQAPYATNEERRLLATYDDENSIAMKTMYAVDKKLGGIMFWQLYDDTFHWGLLSVIDNAR